MSFFVSLARTTVFEIIYAGLETACFYPDMPKVKSQALLSLMAVSAPRLIYCGDQRVEVMRNQTRKVAIVNHCGNTTFNATITDRDTEKAISIQTVHPSLLIDDHNIMPTQRFQSVTEREPRKGEKQISCEREGSSVEVYAVPILEQSIERNKCKRSRKSQTPNTGDKSCLREHAVQKVSPLRYIVLYCIRRSGTMMAMIFYRINKTILWKNYPQRFVLKMSPRQYIF